MNKEEWNNKIFDFIVGHLEDTRSLKHPDGFAPAQEEIANRFHVSQPWVWKRLQDLKKKGRLKLTGKSRGIIPIFKKHD